MYITAKQYAQMVGKSLRTIQQKCARGGFQTAKKLGRDWLIDEDEPYIDGRIKTGKYIGWRKDEEADG